LIDSKCLIDVFVFFKCQLLLYVHIPITQISIPSDDKLGSNGAYEVSQFCHQDLKEEDQKQLRAREKLLRSYQSIVIEDHCGANKHQDKLKRHGIVYCSVGISEVLEEYDLHQDHLVAVVGFLGDVSSIFG